MQISHSDIEVETIVQRIYRKDIDLQPEFQRGDVWSKSKKIKLIDSMLRGWKIPPIHVIVEKSSGEWQVLDGQQRLTAIRDFIDGEFKFDGNIHPLSNELALIDSLNFNALPDIWRRRLMSYEVRFIKLTDFSPEEPAELFFRLNQPVALTAAEQRNAFFGNTRDQVKNISIYLDSVMGGKEGIGFSNSRLAYDDVAARLLFYITYGIDKPFNNEKLVSIYRDESGFSIEAIDKAYRNIKILSVVVKERRKPFRFTKATLLSWLVFMSKLKHLDAETITVALSELESERLKEHNNWSGMRSELISLYNNSVSFRVNETNSVIIRDMIIHWFYIKSMNEIDSYNINDMRIIEELVQEDNRVQNTTISKWIERNNEI